jgi:excisionase family DNA binding protein
MTGASALLTIPQVAERLSLGRSTVYRMLEDGRLRGYHLHDVGGQWRVPETALDAFLAEREHTPRRDVDPMPRPAQGRRGPRRGTFTRALEAVEG